MRYGRSSIGRALANDPHAVRIDRERKVVTLVEVRRQLVAIDREADRQAQRQRRALKKAAASDPSTPR